MIQEVHNHSGCIELACRHQRALLLSPVDECAVTGKNLNMIYNDILQLTALNKFGTNSAIASMNLQTTTVHEYYISEAVCTKNPDQK